MRTRTVWFALVAMLATGGVVFGLGPYDALLTASPDGTLLDVAPRPGREAAAWLAGLGDSGRALCAEYLWWDTGFVLMHGVCSWILLRAALLRLSPGLAPAAWVCVLAVGLDLAENAGLSYQLATWTGSGPAVGWLEVVTVVKLQLVSVVFAAIALAWGLVAARGLLRRRRRSAPTTAPEIRGEMAASR